MSLGLPWLQQNDPHINIWSRCFHFIMHVHEGFMLQSLILHLRWSFTLFMYHGGDSWLRCCSPPSPALNRQFCMVSLQAGWDDGVHKEQRGERPDDEVSAGKLRHAGPQRCSRYASRGSLRARSHPAAAESGPLLLIRLWSCKLQPQPHSVWWVLLCHDALRRGVVLLLWSRVQLLLWCRLKWVALY